MYQSLRHGQIIISRPCLGIEDIFNPIKYIKIIKKLFLFIY